MIDTHCHLDQPPLIDNLNTIIKRSKEHLTFSFDLQIKDVVEESEEIRNYVKKLEKEYDQKSIFDDINLPSLDLVEDLEEFLRKRKE